MRALRWQWFQRRHRCLRPIGIGLATRGSILVRVAYAADIADAGQNILQEGFTKVRDQFEAAQESLVRKVELFTEFMDEVRRDHYTWQLAQSTASLKSFQIEAIQSSVDSA